MKMMKKIAVFLCLTLGACVPSDPDIYVINLDRTPERYKKTKAQFDKQAIQCIRFCAIDGYKLDFQNADTKQFLSAEQKKNFAQYVWKNRPAKYNVFLNGRKLMQIVVDKVRFSLGEVGVACSHREIWKKVIENGYDKVIIFEDDIAPGEDFKNRLNEYLNDLPDDWDIAYLGVGRRGNKYGYFICVGSIFRDIDNVEGHPFVAKIQPTNLVYGMYGYAINKRGAKKLLKATDESSFPIDDIVFQQGGIDTGNVKGYVAKKKLIKIIPERSEITNMGRHY